jgi:hypothetical protein
MGLSLPVTFIPWLISVNGLQEPSLRLKLKRVPEKFTNVNLV